MKMKLGDLVYLVCDINESPQPYIITGVVDTLQGRYFLISCGTESFKVMPNEIMVQKPFNHLLN